MSTSQEKMSEDFSQTASPPFTPGTDELFEDSEPVTEPVAKPDIVRRNGQMVPRLPFCAAYDGVNCRRTRTISVSIQNVIQSQSQSDASLLDDEFCPLRRRLDELNIQSDDTSSSSTDVKPERLFVLSGTERTTKILHDVDPCLGLGDTDNGFVDLSLDYKAWENCLNIAVRRAKIPKKHGTFPDTFVTVNLTQKGVKRYRTRIIQGDRDPNFDEMFVIEHVYRDWMHILAIKVQLWQKKLFGKVVVGQSLIWLDDIDIQLYGKMDTRLLLK